MHEYVNWHDPLRNRRHRFLEESHLRVFTQLDDYHILTAGCFGSWSLHAVFLPRIYDCSFVAEIGMKYAETVLCKTGFSFPWNRNVFSACFVRSATGNADAQEYYCLIWTNINPESKFYLCIYLFIILSINIFIWDFWPFQNYFTYVEPINKQR